MKFSEKLAKLRKGQNLSQEQLAEKLNVSRQSVSKWESGSSYPEMEKIIQLCKILNCSLDAIIDDEATGNKTPTDNKMNWSFYIQEVLNFITQSFNMFWSMKLGAKIKCVIEMGTVFVILIFAWTLVNWFVSGIFDSMSELLPTIMKRIIGSIYELIFNATAFITTTMVIIHMFKIRYLDYYISVEDKEVTERQIEQPITEDGSSANKQNEGIKREIKIATNSKPRQEKIIIRDTQHSTYAFFQLLGRIALLFIKIGILFVSIPLIISFVGLIAMDTFSWLNANESLFFMGLGIAILGGAILNFVVLYFIYNFVFNQKYAFKIIFTMIMSGLILAGVGTALFLTDYLNFEKVVSEERPTKKLQVEMADNLVLSFWEDIDTEIVVDNNIENIDIAITHDQMGEPSILEENLMWTDEGWQDLTEALAQIENDQEEAMETSISGEIAKNERNETSEVQVDLLAKENALPEIKLCQLETSYSGLTREKMKELVADTKKKKIRDYHQEERWNIQIRVSEKNREILEKNYQSFRNMREE